MQTFGVNAVVFNDSGQVLLTLRSDIPVWCLPGGAIEAGETQLQAAKRETFEESGAVIEVDGVVGIYSRPFWQDGGNHEVVFKGRQIGGELVSQDGEAVKIEYFDVSDLPKDLLWWHRERIFDALNESSVVCRLQDARMPLFEQGYEEAMRRFNAGVLPVAEVVEHLCLKPDDAESYLEL